MAVQLDDIDLKLLTELERDADRPNVELARLVGLSPAATFNRVRRLKEAGVIERVSARINAEATGLTMQVYVQVTLGRHDDAAHNRFAKAMQEIPEVIAADWVTGETDALLVIVAADVAALQRVLLLLSSRGGAQRVTTLLRLEELKPRSPLPLVLAEAERRRPRRARRAS